MATFNEELFDAMLRHQIGLLRFSGTLRNRIFRLLDATESDIRAQIQSRLHRGSSRALTPAALRRADRLFEAIKATRIRAWKQVDELWFGELRKFAVAESKFVAGIIGTTFPVELGFQIPDPARLRAIVNTRPFEGRTLREWAQNIRRADLDRIQAQIRIGLTQGETLQQISRRIVGTASLRGRNGVTAITRRQAEAITRTAVNAIGAASREELYAANADIIQEEVFAATLDDRTTPICRSLDGKRFKVGEGPRLPLHFKERSLRLPSIDGEVVGERPIKEFTRKQLIREFSEQQGLARVPRNRGGLPHGTKGKFDDFARRRMRELTGTTPAKTTYAEFLRRQSAAFQDDVLGKTKGRLFRQGGLDLDRFVDSSGRELTLAEIARFDAQAFRNAGLDPSDFLVRRSA